MNTKIKWKSQIDVKRWQNAGYSHLRTHLHVSHDDDVDNDGPWRTHKLMHAAHLLHIP